MMSNFRLIVGLAFIGVIISEVSFAQISEDSTIFNYNNTSAPLGTPIDTVVQGNVPNSQTVNIFDRQLQSSDIIKIQNQSNSKLSFCFGSTTSGSCMQSGKEVLPQSSVQYPASDIAGSGTIQKYLRVTNKGGIGAGNSTAHFKVELPTRQAGACNPGDPNAWGPNGSSLNLCLDYNKIGIGLTTPATHTVHLKNASPFIRFQDDTQQPGSSEVTEFTIGNDNGAGRLISNHHIGVFLDADNNNTDETFQILTNSGYWGGSVRSLFTVNGNGNGSLCGTFLAREVVVQTGWCDYVFEKNYKLMPLKELEVYLANNKHLPEIPTQKHVEDNGVQIGEMQMLQMKKIEELTLYLIELNKKVETLSAENELLKKSINK